MHPLALRFQQHPPRFQQLAQSAPNALFTGAGSDAKCYAIFLLVGIPAAIRRISTSSGVSRSGATSTVNQRDHPRAVKSQADPQQRNARSSLSSTSNSSSSTLQNCPRKSMCPPPTGLQFFRLVSRFEFCQVRGHFAGPAAFRIELDGSCAGIGENQIGHGDGTAVGE